MFNLLLTLHILAAVWLMGHLISAAFWKARADRSGNPETIATTAQALVRSDLMFIGPGIIVLLGTGIWMAGLTGWERFQEIWLGTSFFLVIVMVILWLAVLLPQQRRMARFAAEIREGIDRSDDYQRASKLWSMAGGIMTLIPVIVLFLMVFKP
jgi:uncharacterized membrane protein